MFIVANLRILWSTHEMLNSNGRGFARISFNRTSRLPSGLVVGLWPSNSHSQVHVISLLIHTKSPFIFPIPPKTNKFNAHILPDLLRYLLILISKKFDKNVQITSLHEYRSRPHLELYRDWSNHRRFSFWACVTDINCHVEKSERKKWNSGRSSYAKARP